MPLTVKYKQSAALPSTLGQPYVDLRPVAAKTAAGVSLGRVIEQRVAELKEERDLNLAREAYNDFADMMRAKRSELESRTGSAAYNLNAEYDEFYEKNFNKMMGERFDQNAQAKIFSAYAANRRGQDLERLAGYEARQHQIYKDQQEAGQIAQAQTDIRDASAGFAADPDGYADFVERNVDAMESEIARLRPHEDNTEKIALLRSGLYSAAVQEMIESDAFSARKYLEKWRPDLGEAYHDWKGRLEKSAEKDIKSSAYAAIDTRFGDNHAAKLAFVQNPKNWVALGLNFETSGELATRYRTQINDAEAAFDRSKKFLKELQAENDIDVLAAFNEGRLAGIDVDALFKNRQISAEVYKAVKTSDRGINDPYEVAEISRLINFKNFDQAIARAKTALAEGRIKREKYISLTDRASKEEVAEGSRMLSAALKPYDLRFNPDRALRYAEADEQYDAGLRAGRDPLPLAKDIIDGYTHNLRRTRQTIPQSAYLKGEQTIEAIESAIVAAAADYANGILTTEQYKIEVEQLERLKTLIGDEAGSSAVSDEVAERIKQSKKLGR